MKSERTYEDAAEQRTVTGWVCRSCLRFHGNSAMSEEIARHCCSPNAPCSREGCTGRSEKGYTLCRGCLDLAAETRWESRKAVPWSGDVTERAIYSDEYDRYFEDVFDFDEWAGESSADELYVTRESAHLMTTKPVVAREFRIDDWLDDLLPDEADDLPDGARKAEREINDILRGLGILSYQPADRINLATLPPVKEEGS